MKKPTWLNRLTERNAEAQGELPDTAERQKFSEMIYNFRQDYFNELLKDFSEDYGVIIKQKRFIPIQKTWETLEKGLTKEIKPKEKEELLKLEKYIREIYRHPEDTDRPAARKARQCVLSLIHLDYAAIANAAVDKHNEQVHAQQPALVSR